MPGLLHIAGAETQEKATDEERRRAKEWEAAIAARRSHDPFPSCS
jgi:hypothetical protein